jgi:hypothetical protein
MAVALSPVERELRDRYFQELLETAFRLQQGPDPEVALEALIEASGMLQHHLQRELDELRQEQAD